MITKTFKTHSLKEATKKMEAAEVLGLMFDFEHIELPLCGASYEGEIYTHTDKGYSVKVYFPAKAGEAEF